MKRSKIAVVLFIYKRKQNFPDIIKAVRQYSPKKLYLIADGESGNSDSIAIKTRLFVENLIDWECVIEKNYSGINLGLKKRFKTGIDWVFEHEDMAIFLEDDCIPDISFFDYCEELLYKYNSDERIMTISGNNFQPNSSSISESYYFSKFPHIWGWATWRRAWKLYDSNMLALDKPAIRDQIFQEINKNIFLNMQLILIFKLIKKNYINTWDYQLVYSSLIHGRIHILPAKNLVENVGVDSLATHTKTKSKMLGQLKNSIKLPLIHPTNVAINEIYDSYTANHIYMNVKSLIGTGARYLCSILGIKI